MLTTDGHEDRVYDITGPELVSQADLAALVAEITGRPVEAVAIDDEAAAQALVDVGLPPELAARLRVVRHRDPRRCADGPSAPPCTT